VNTISEGYLSQQQALHAAGQYGCSGHKYAELVTQLAERIGTSDILDYGCGQRTLERALGFLIRNYDPAIPEFAEVPIHGADLLVSTDVLEHIEPGKVDAVLDDIARLTKKLCFLIIDMKPAKKFLNDGRNAHLIQEGPKWWLPKIMERMELISFKLLGREFAVIARPL
jgi:hypothetical protein